MSVPQSTITAHGVSAEIDNRTIVSDCSFTLNAGQFIAIVGPNGAGKSTLLRVLAGVIPYRGALRFAGEELAKMNLAARARGIAYLPQNGGVYWPMRVRDIVALGRLPFGATLQRLSPSDTILVERAMEDCNVTEFAERSAPSLSGGELSRVLLARLIASDAPIILADEPAASLDPAHQIAVMQLLERKAAEGKTVVAISHDIALAARYAERMIVMEDGRIAAADTPTALLDSGILERIFRIRFHRIAVEGGTALTISPLI